MNRLFPRGSGDPTLSRADTVWAIRAGGARSARLGTCAFAERAVWNIRNSEAVSLRLAAGELDHLGPFFGLVGDELAEIGRRAGKRHCPEVRKPRLQHGIGEASIDLPIEPLDDCEGRILRHAEPEIAARLIARNEFVYGRNVRQRFRTRQRAYR